MHVQGIIDLVVNTIFLVYLLSTISLEASELQCFESIKFLQMYLLDWETGYTSIISYDIVLSAQMGPFNAPADIAWDASYLVDNARLVIH